ncbi:integrase [Streptomyces sp. NPDC091219]|uniref:integrase n=1 Tax=Streptomyces sp. NPDC091219 TaxID=3155193 RepID=UPI00344CD570
MDARWDRTPGNTRRTIAEALATSTIAFMDQGAVYRGDARVLRRAVYSCAFNKNAWVDEPREEWRPALDWLERNSLPVAELDDPVMLRHGLDALCRKLDGTVAAPKMTKRKRAALEAVHRLPGRGPHPYAFFGCMYFAGMRPAEVINLRKSQCRLPWTGWGLLNLKGGIVASGKEWTDDGAAHEAHPLKRRAARATRPVPIPPVLVRMLLEHIALFGVAADGRIFQNAAGNYIDCSAYNITWGRAREAVLTVDEHALSLAKRPYDLRHAGISFWLASGVDPAECARRAGQSIQVLFRYYAKFLAGARDHANQLIENSMNRWEKPAVPDGDGLSGIWSGNIPEQLGRGEAAAGGNGSRGIFLLVA